MATVTRPLLSLVESDGVQGEFLVHSFLAGTEPVLPLIASIFTQQDLSARVPSAQGALLLPPLYSFPKALYGGSSCYQASICSLQWALPSL